MLERIYGRKTEDKMQTAESMAEALAEYKLKTVLRHLNMSTFDYDIKADKMYVQKDSVLLENFTPHWFEDGGDYYYLEHVTERLKDIIRDSFLGATLQEAEKVRNNTTGEMVSFDAPIIYNNGSTRWTNFVFNTVLDEDGVPVQAIGYCKDIHEQKKELFRLRKISQTDALTGFRNRVAGTYRIQTKLNEEKDSTFFMAVIDLNKFKDANDLFGHSFGDLILKNVSERMREMEDHEVICCRTGGDEFLFFRKCADENHAKELLTKLARNIEHIEAYQGIEFNVTASIGAVLYPIHGIEFEELYNKADIAMYYAKNNLILDPVFYDETMDSVRK